MSTVTYSYDSSGNKVATFNGSGPLASNAGTLLDGSTIAIITGHGSISTNAFLGCTSLTSIVLPYDLIYIDTDAFLGCTNLTSITLPAQLPPAYTTHFYYGCTSMTSITVPEGVKTIDENAFLNWTEMTSIKLPSTLTTIEYNAFSGCTGLTSITIPDGVTSISFNSFGGCTNLNSVKLPSSLTTIGNNAFVNCRSIRCINMPRGLKSIGNDAFSNTGLEVIKMPSSVTTIGNNAFKNFYTKPLDTVFLDENNGLGIAVPQTKYSFYGATVNIVKTTVLASPTNVTAAPGDALCQVTWVAPANNGGAAIAGYTIYWNGIANFQHVSSELTQTTIEGLSNGQSYAFTVVAQNILGDSASSTLSNSVTPIAIQKIIPVINKPSDKKDNKKDDKKKKK